MPSELPPLREAPKLDIAGASLEYARLLAFLEFASGFNLALAIGNQPVRELMIEQVRQDATKFGLTVNTVRLGADSSTDLVSVVQKALGDLAHAKGPVIMITGIDSIIYRSADELSLSSRQRSTSVGILNLNRD